MTAATQRPISIVDERTFTTKSSDGTDLTVSIDNAYSDYINAPARLDDIIGVFVTTLDQARNTNESVDQLVVIVRPSDYLVRSLPPGASLAAFVGSRPLAGDLSLYLAVDSPTALRTAIMDDLRRWKIDEAKAWSIGTSNLKARIGPLSVVHFGDANGPTGWGADSGLAPSMLADPDVCGPTAPEWLNRMIVLVLTRDTLLFALPDDKHQTTEFWAAAKAAIAAQSSLSSTPITCRGGHWAAVPLP